MISDTQLTLYADLYTRVLNHPNPTPRETALAAVVQNLLIEVQELRDRIGLLESDSFNAYRGGL